MFGKNKIGKNKIGKNKIGKMITNVGCLRQLAYKILDIYNIIVWRPTIF
jgi:hypothetical protein